MSLPIRRPVAVAMFFLGIVLMGAVAWQRMPVELFPALAGDRLFVSFTRPGSESQVVEREILLPLQARVAALPRVSESWGEIRGSSGRFQVRFEPGAAPTSRCASSSCSASRPRCSARSRAGPRSR